VAILLVLGIVLRSADVQFITGSKFDIAPALDLGTYDVEVVTGIEANIAACLELAWRRSPLSAIGTGGAMAGTDTDLEPATATTTDTGPI